MVVGASTVVSGANSGVCGGNTVTMFFCFLGIIWLDPGDIGGRHGRKTWDWPLVLKSLLIIDFSFVEKTQIFITRKITKVPNSQNTFENTISFLKS